MATKDVVMSRAAEMEREASETHELWKEWRRRTGWSAEQTRWKGKRRKLTRWGKNDDEGRSDEQSSRDGNGSVWNSRAGERMTTKARVMLRTAEWQGRRLELTNCGRNADEGPCDEESGRGWKGSVWNSLPVDRMPSKDGVMSRAAGMARETSETHVLWK
jgi:hypothetical protein